MPLTHKLLRKLQQQQLVTWQLPWWLLALALAFALKHHYSIATVNELQWVFRPLTLLLEGITGHHFQQDSYGEWFSRSANIRLVKSCAGINFMIMSFLTYAWILRPDSHATENYFFRAIGQLLLLCAAIVAAWATCLLGNCLRIMAATAADSHHWQLETIGIHNQQLHRLIGMLIYVPLLSLQMRLGGRDKLNHKIVWLVPVVLYLLLMVIVPLLTGNALQNPEWFFEHSIPIVAMAVLLVVTLAVQNKKREGN